jgi:hypothetical protein
MLLNPADKLKQRLDQVEGLAGVAVEVDRKLDLRSLAAAAIGKATTGAFLSISLGGWSPVNEDSGPDEYWATLRYELTLATMPHILEARQMPCFDEVLRRLVLAVHGWTPPGAGGAYCPERRWKAGAGSWVPDEDFLVYMFPATIGEDFAAPLASDL